jgi:hypothetical protein
LNPAAWRYQRQSTHADAAGPQGIIIVGGYLSRFVDDCGNNVVRHKWPFPPPRADFDDKLSALELIVLETASSSSASTRY